MEPIIVVDQLTFRYDLRTEEHVINNLSFTVKQGEWLAIIGDNGSGKSTLAQLLVGLLTPQFGKINISHMEMNESTKWDIRQKVGLVFQNPDHQFIGTTVQDDIAFGLENINMPYREMKVRVDQALDLVGMTEFRFHDPSRLSGGQKQRVAIAGILALEPEIIILDEATSMLDPKGRAEVLETVKAVKEKSNLTVLSITHDINEAAQADRIFVLEKGQIKYVNVPEEIFKLGDELIDLGLTVPFVEQLKNKLIKNNIHIPDKFMTEERLVEWLWTYDSKM